MGRPRWSLQLYSGDFELRQLEATAGEVTEFPPGSGVRWRFEDDAVTLVEQERDRAWLTTLDQGVLVQIDGRPFAVALAAQPEGAEKGICVGCGASIAEEDTRSGRAFLRESQPVCIACLCRETARGQVLCGRYEVLRELGRGGQAAIYFAVDRQESRPVALKVMHGLGGSAERFVREARVGGRLHHPCVVQTLDAAEHEGRPFLVLEYVPGTSLDLRIEQHGPLPEAQVRQVGLCIARALCFAEELGVVHRDIKPANILLLPDGRAKLSDFGLAKQLEESGLTAAGSFLGTVPFCSPEQLGDARGADHRADLYSLGATLFQLASGALPFDGDSRINLVWKISTQEPAWEPLEAAGVSDDLRATLADLLRKDRAERLQTAAELIERLADPASANPRPAR